jgi:prolyl oligopeptidase
LFFNFTSFLVPNSVYRITVPGDVTAMFKKVESGVNDADFTIEQKWYASKDGTQVPMFIIAKKGVRRDGKNPTLLYGYGGFDISITPYFEKNAIPFLENGGVYAVANIRGGGEFGETWHEAGMRKNKQNVFDDFIAAAEYLIAEKYTSSNKLAIFGWSNGGLLAGACLTERPDLYRAVVVGNPVLDMLRFQKFNGGALWTPGFGNSEEPDMVPYPLKYHPYHNVKGGTKYPVLLRIENKAGHSGAESVSATVEQQSDIWSFVFQELGMNGNKQVSGIR